MAFVGKTQRLGWLGVWVPVSPPNFFTSTPGVWSWLLTRTSCDMGRKPLFWPHLHRPSMWSHHGFWQLPHKRTPGIMNEADCVAFYSFVLGIHMAPLQSRCLDRGVHQSLSRFKARESRPPCAMCLTVLTEPLKGHCHLHSQYAWQIITTDANHKTTVTPHSCN